jgi:HD superfamily phosphodiesterase
MEQPTTLELIAELGKHSGNLDHITSHTERVLSLSLELGDIIGGDKEIIIPAAIFHDSEFINGFHGHGARGAMVFGQLFGERYPKQILRHIQDCILTHPILPVQTPKTIEAKCLRDADRIDSIGSYIFQRYLAAMEIEKPEERSEEVNRRINGWFNSMTTDAGREMFLLQFAKKQQIFKELGLEIKIP